MLKSFDMFSGYGGFAIAGERNGIETVGFSEIDKYASRVLKYRFPGVNNYGDCKKIDYKKRVPDFDLLNGGSPCQSFSIAGKRKGLAGASGLVWEYLRCLREKKPKYFIWENVKGALSSRRGLDFANILTAFSEQGYSLWWQVLNAKDFGVPQNRERVFVVGFRNGSPREIFFERADNKAVVATGIGANYAKGDNRPGNKSGRTLIHQISRTPLKFLSRNQKNIEGDYAFCVDRANSGGIIFHDRVRRLTPTECERLMGLQDGWLRWGINDKGEKVEISDSQRYKMAGNGVVVNVVEAVMKILLDKDI